MRDLAITIVLLSLVSCSGGRQPPVESPGRPPSGSGDGVKAGGSTAAGKGCWDEEPCPYAPDTHCHAPGTPTHGGKTPELEGPGGPIPGPCETDADCQPANEVCSDGACSPTPCSTSDDCDGYCIDGRCWSEPGFCDSDLRP